MKTGKISSIWIIIKTIAVTLYFSLLVIWAAYFQKNQSRKKINDIAYRWSVTLLKIVNASYKVIAENPLVFVPNRCYIIMSNHASHYDIPLIFVSFPKKCVRMIAKKELFKVPIWGYSLKVGEFISIDRVNRRQALLDLKAAKEKMANGVMQWIAPEGTRSRNGELGSFKKGGFVLALQTNAIIIPVGIKGSGKILPPKTMAFGVGEKIEVHIGDPIDSGDYSSKNVEKLMEKVENSIKSLV
jgi:1-acyl-sn-glycerol-3-phosphate acyltransferase